jgi:hypothetical protein
MTFKQFINESKDSRKFQPVEELMQGGLVSKELAEIFPIVYTLLEHEFGDEWFATYIDKSQGKVWDKVRSVTEEKTMGFFTNDPVYHIMGHMLESGWVFRHTNGQYKLNPEAKDDASRGFVDLL